MGRFVVGCQAIIANGNVYHLNIVRTWTTSTGSSVRNIVSMERLSARTAFAGTILSLLILYLGYHKAISGSENTEASFEQVQQLLRTYRWEGSPTTESGKHPQGHWHGNWSAVFHFVPNALRSCFDLFADEDKTKPFPVDFQIPYEKFLDKVKATSKVIEGTSANYLEEYMSLYQLAKAPFIRTVCETGFNAGHSSFIWLQANPHTYVYSFDLGSHHYGRPIAQYLQRKFPRRLNVTWGDSSETLPAFRRQNPDVTCDLILIDGGHTYDVCKADYDNFIEMASPDNIVVLDNYPDKRLGTRTLGDVWEGGKRSGELIEIFQCDYEPRRRQGFSVGRFNVN